MTNSVLRRVLRYGPAFLTMSLFLTTFVYFRIAFEFHGFGRAAFHAIDVALIAVGAIGVACVGIVADRSTAWSIDTSRVRWRLRGILSLLALVSLFLGAFAGPFFPFDPWSGLRCSFVLSVAGLLAIPLTAAWLAWRLSRFA